MWARDGCAMPESRQAHEARCNPSPRSQPVDCWRNPPNTCPTAPRHRLAIAARRTRARELRLQLAEQPTKPHRRPKQLICAAALHRPPHDWARCSVRIIRILTGCRALCDCHCTQRCLSRDGETARQAACQAQNSPRTASACLRQRARSARCRAQQANRWLLPTVAQQHLLRCRCCAAADAAAPRYCPAPATSARWPPECCNRRCGLAAAASTLRAAIMWLHPRSGTHIAWHQRSARSTCHHAMLARV